MQPRYAICRETYDDSAGQSVMGPLFGKVVRLGDTLNGEATVYYGAAEKRVAWSALTEVAGVRFGVGSPVLYKGAPATIREVIWHHKDARPNYYVTQAGKRVSKRLADADLAPDERSGG